jgi:nudix-type nucleoside diphosphatase (YffH/AdpP family)
VEPGDLTDRLLSVRRPFEGWFSLVSLRIASNGEEIDRPVIEHPSGIAVLAFDPQRRVALTIRQMRPAVLHLDGPVMDEAIAGALEDGDAEACARREAMEEAGVQLGTLERVAHVWMTPSSTTERVWLYLGPYGPADRVAEGGGLAEEGEHLEVAERPLAELWARAQGGAMTDAKLLMLLQALRIRRPELFDA